MKAVIEVKGIEKVYSGFRSKLVKALREVSFRVERGMIFGLIGQNGAGKTSLVKILLGLSWPTSGSAQVLGSPPQNPATRRRLGYLPEHMRIPDYFGAEDFLRYMGALNGIDSRSLRKTIPSILEKVGLAGNRKQVRAYSKGMQQRLGLAQALVNDPEILFLDEPTDGLDPLGRKDVRNLLIAQRAEGKTIFLNSHLLSEVELICDQIAMMEKGSLVRLVTPTEFTRGTGEYVVRLGPTTEEVRTAAKSALGGEVVWERDSFRFAPRDLAHLNALLDRLRSTSAEIESVEPIRLSLEDFFIGVVGEKPADVGHVS